VDHRAHRRPVALSDGDETQPLEDLDRLANRGPVHPELLRQLALGRKLLPGRETRVEDRVAQLIGDVLVEAAPDRRAERDDGDGRPLIQWSNQLSRSPTPSQSPKTAASGAEGEREVNLPPGDCRLSHPDGCGAERGSR